jgi:succinate-semialdehyde dehydrogenase/glutarate-semialdehyde dehydrogenase
MPAPAPAPSIHADTLDVIDPATDEIIGAVPDQTPVEAQQALDQAAAAGPAWAALAPRQRSDVLRRAFELMSEAQDTLAEIIVKENGKPLADAIGEARYATEFMRWYSEETVRIAGTHQIAPDGGNRILTARQPVGVCVMVTPWNFPAAMITRKIAPALGAGCSMAVKPAAETPLTALFLAELLTEAGLPDGVLNVVTTTDAGAVVEAMLDHHSVRMLSFTGSTAVGRLLLGHAARRVLNTSMELGGNAPFIVLDDADVDAAVSGAMVAKMRNGGQACTAANRFYVHDSLVDEFVTKLAAQMDALQIGHGLAPGIDVGPVITHAAQQRIAASVDATLRQGAQTATTAQVKAGPGSFYPPTVLTGVKADARILQGEIFGPVAPVVAVAGDDEAVHQANATEVGLAGYLYTRDLRRGLHIGDRLDVGMIGLNRGLVSDPAAPFGGVKQSGIGREGGQDGIHEFTETKYFAIA